MTVSTLQHRYKSEEEKQNSQKTKTQAPRTPGKDSLKIHVENMNEDQLYQAMETINEDPNNKTIKTIIDKNAIDDNYKIKRI